MSKSFEQWVELYNKKIPEGFQRDERFALYYSPERGFAELGDSGKMIIVNQVSGELKFWREVVEKLARRRGRSHAGTISSRPILPYMRLAGLEIVKKDKTEFGEQYFFRDKRTGQTGRASPTDKGSYLITWEVTANGI